MSRGHSLVPGLETRPFHIIVRDEGHTKAAGVGVQCGRRRFATHPEERASRLWGNFQAIEKTGEYAFYAEGLNLELYRLACGYLDMPDTVAVGWVKVWVVGAAEETSWTRKEASTGGLACRVQGCLLLPCGCWGGGEGGSVDVRGGAGNAAHGGETSVGQWALGSPGEGCSLQLSQDDRHQQPQQQEQQATEQQDAEPGEVAVWLKPPEMLSMPGSLVAAAAIFL